MPGWKKAVGLLDACETAHAKTAGARGQLKAIRDLNLYRDDAERDLVDRRLGEINATLFAGKHAFARSAVAEKRRGADRSRRGFLVAVHDCRIDRKCAFWNQIPSSLLVQGDVKMPGDPKECRQHAERCAELARLASTPEARDQFLSLQRTWIRLASELDQARALIEVTQELEGEQPIKAVE